MKRSKRERERMKNTWRVSEWAYLERRRLWCVREKEECYWKYKRRDLCECVYTQSIFIYRINNTCLGLRRDRVRLEETPAG